MSLCVYRSSNFVLAISLWISITDTYDICLLNITTNWTYQWQTYKESGNCNALYCTHTKFIKFPRCSTKILCNILNIKFSIQHSTTSHQWRKWIHYTTNSTMQLCNGLATATGEKWWNAFVAKLMWERIKLHTSQAVTLNVPCVLMVHSDIYFSSTSSRGLTEVYVSVYILMMMM